MLVHDSRHPKAQMSINDMAKAAEWTINMSAKPDWQLIDVHLSYVPDPEYPYDVRMIERIRNTFDPGFVPIFRKKIYKTPTGGVKVFLHHGIARYDRAAQPDMGLRRAFRPHSGPAVKWLGWPNLPPNVIERWFTGTYVEGSIRQAKHLPKPFIPWGDWVEKWARETYWAASAAEKKAYVDKFGDAAVKQKAADFEQAEADYINKDEDKRRKNLIANWSAADTQELKARAGGWWEEPTRPSIAVPANTKELSS